MVQPSGCLPVTTFPSAPVWKVAPHFCSSRLPGAAPVGWAWQGLASLHLRAFPPTSPGSQASKDQRAWVWVLPTISVSLPVPAHPEAPDELSLLSGMSQVCSATSALPLFTFNLFVSP